MFTFDSACYRNAFLRFHWLIACERRYCEEDTDNYICLQMALTSVETLLDFVDQRGIKYNDKIALRKIRNEIRKLLRDSQKQTRITDFVNK